MSGGLPAVAEALRAASQVVCCAHVGADPDAAGSALALGLGLRALGVDVAVTWPAPFVPSEYAWLPGTELLVPPQDAVAAGPPEVAVALDCAGEDRLHELGPLCRRAATFAVLDHHVTNPGFGGICVVDPAAASTGVLVRRLLALLDVELDAAIATCLFASLSADTGRFRYPGSDADAFALAAELAAAGADVVGVGEAIWATSRIGVLRLTGEVLAAAELDAARRLIWAHVDALRLARFGVSPAEAGDLVEDLARCGDAEVACMIRDLPGGGVKVSLRSRGHVDVAAIAVSAGGGGHPRAAGFRADDAAGALAHVGAAIDAASRTDVSAPTPTAGS